MKIKWQPLIAFLIFPFTIAKAQDVKNYSEINFTDIMAYYEGTPYTGEVVDEDSKGDRIYDGTYKNAHPTGEIKKWFSRGNVKGSQEYDYNYDENGILDGLSADWFENGQKQDEINYVHGKKDDKASYFDESGKELEEINYKNDAIDGDWVMFRNGVKRSVTLYANGVATEFQVYSADGKPDSTWIYYDASGKIQKTENYVNGIKEGTSSTYDENGNVTSTNYHNGVIDIWHNFMVANITSEMLKDNNLFTVPDARQNQTVYGELMFNENSSRVATAVEGENAAAYLNPLISAIKNNFHTIRGVSELLPSEFPNHISDTVMYQVICYNILITVTAHSNLSNQFDGYIATIDFDIDKYMFNPPGNGILLTNKHIRINPPRIIGVIPYQTEGQAYYATLQKNSDNNIRSQINDFIFQSFPIYSALSQVLSKKPDGSASEVQIEQGKNIGIDEGWVMDVYEPGNPNPIGTIETKEINESSALCKVKGGGDNIANKIQSGIKLYSLTRTQ